MPVHPSELEITPRSCSVDIPFVTSTPSIHSDFSATLSSLLCSLPICWFHSLPLIPASLPHLFPFFVSVAPNSHSLHISISSTSAPELLNNFGENLETIPISSTTHSSCLPSTPLSFSLYANDSPSYLSMPDLSSSVQSHISVFPKCYLRCPTGNSNSTWQIQHFSSLVMKGRDMLAMLNLCYAGKKKNPVKSQCSLCS